MTKRKHIGTGVETEVLVASGRRCCLCYGLEGDFEIKRGQIAHLDGDASNNQIENLVFLCLEHHDLFDGKLKQSKNLTREEVRFYREVLRKDVQRDLPRSTSDTTERLRHLINSQRAPGEPAEGLLSAAEIESAVESGFLSIDPYSEDNLTAASYSVTVGEWGMIVGTSAVREIAEDNPLVLKRGDTAIITTEEIISLPYGILGRLIPHVNSQRIGIAVAHGTHVEPGFMGRLTVNIENRARRRVALARRTVLAGLEFSLLASSRTPTYKKSIKHRNLPQLPSFDGATSASRRALA